MKCCFCGHMESKVIDSRPVDEGAKIRRRRECLECGRRFTTYEVVESMPIIVIKKDSSRQQFDRNKIIKGILRACEKRPVDIDSIESLVDEIEAQIQNSLRREITSSEIGDIILEKLRETDEVAYVRFASVYKDFRDIDSFMDELSMLKEDRN